MNRAQILVAAMGLTVVAGCGTNDPPAAAAPPVPPPPPVAIEDAGGPPPPAIVRRVENRDPFGNTRIANNLVVDGDFELTGRSGQMPWRAFTQEGPATLDYATGGQCRSGIRCAQVSKGEIVIGFMASPKVGGMTVSLWARPASGKCADLDVHAIDLDSETGAASVTSDATPDASGWCHFAGTVSNYAGRSPGLWLEPRAEATGSIVVDDVVVLPSQPEKGTKLLAFVETSAALRARIKATSDWIRKNRQYGLRREPPLENPPRRPALFH
jgi:hypothetical protein